MIWERAEPCRQLISLSLPNIASAAETAALVAASTPLRLTEPLDVYLQYRRPGLLHACYDARIAGLKRFTPAFKSYLPSPIRLDFDFDYLELDMHMVEYIASVHEESGLTPVEPPKVKNLAVSHYRQIRGEDFVLICQYFSGLERLMINEPEINDSTSTGGYPNMFQPLDANFIARHRWKDLRKPIMKKIRGIRPKLTKWGPPALLIGTDTQWAQFALKSVKITFLDIPRPIPCPGPSSRPSNPDIMDWQPTINISSLEFIPRLETAGSEIGI